MRELVDAARSGDLENASRLVNLFPLFRDLFVESNPIPAKAALAEMGLCRDGLRLPLVPMSSSARRSLVVLRPRGAWLSLADGEPGQVPRANLRDIRVLRTRPNLVRYELPRAALDLHRLERRRVV